jgi:hypothetical protein
MEIHQYDTVLLKDGRKAVIVEVFSSSKFLADVGSSPDDWDTIGLSIDNIEAVIPDNLTSE